MVVCIIGCGSNPVLLVYPPWCHYSKQSAPEISQTEHTIETEANIIKQYVCILHRSQLLPKLRTVPSAGLEVVKESLCICTNFKSQLFRCEPSKLTIALIISIVCLDPAIVGSILGNCQYEVATCVEVEI